jgi:DNA primase
VLAEGNLDVIASHQAGVRQVVATAGTALTEPHLKALSRFTGDMRLSFDADKAGLNATERAIPIASKVKVSLGIITVPSGKDPDELIKQDPEAWKAVIHQPQYALDWLIERYQSLLDITSAAGKREFSDVLLPVVRALDDAVEQDHYLLQIAKLIGVSKDALLQKTATIKAADRTGQTLKRKRTANEPIDKRSVEDKHAQDHFLALMLLQPELRDLLAPVTPDMLYEPDSQKLLEFLLAYPDFTGKPDTATVIPASEPESSQKGVAVGDTNSTGSRIKSGMTITSLKPIEDYVKIIGLQYEELYQGLELTELRYEAARLQTRLVERYVKTQKQTLAAQLADSDDATTTSLLGQVKQLDALLKSVKGRL